MARTVDEFALHYNRICSEFFATKRAESGLLLEEVADKIDIKANTLFSYEIGRRGMPIKVFRSLCKIYRIDFFETFRTINSLTVESILKSNK